jgi:NADP-dependent 3-hydroxy acid dehydrogenase YdfG
MTIKGKVALVTGASSGIGAATALKLAENGVKVGLAARRIDRLMDLQNQIHAAGGAAIAIEMVDESSVAAGVDRLARELGTIDIVFNNAGLMPVSDVESLKTDEWHRMVDVNLTGLLNTPAAVLPYMTRQLPVTSSIHRLLPAARCSKACRFTARQSTQSPRLVTVCAWNLRPNTTSA